MDHRLLGILSQRPRLISEFPDWMLPHSTLDALKKTKEAAVAEIAGRDSVAAAIKAVELKSIKAILPTIAYTGTEFGDWEIPYEKCLFLKNRLKGAGIHVYDPVFLGDPAFWHRLCGRYQGHFFQRLGFFSSCIGCHLYLHVIRVPLAKIIGARLLISGEREHHEGRIKLNQIPECLDAYIGFLARYDLELFLPLRDISDGEELEAILGHHWEEGKEQMNCVLSKNYLNMNGQIISVCHGSDSKRLQQGSRPCVHFLPRLFKSARKDKSMNPIEYAMHDAKTAIRGFLEDFAFKEAEKQLDEYLNPNI